MAGKSRAKGPTKKPAARKDKSKVNKPIPTKDAPKKARAKGDGTRRSSEHSSVKTGVSGASAPNSDNRRQRPPAAPALRHGPRPVPELSAATAFRHPTKRIRTLANGLAVQVVRKPGTPLVEIRLRVPFGVAPTRGSTPRAHAARAEMLAATVLLGTRTRTRDRVDAELAVVGGHLDASADPQRFLVSGSVLSHGLDVLLDVLADSLTDAAFHDRDVAGERDRIAEHLAIAAAQPSVIARSLLQHRRFGAHPAAVEMPTVAAVGAVGPAALRALVGRSLLPSGSTLILVGDLSPAKALDQVERALSGWTRPGRATALTPPPNIQPRAMLAQHRDGAVQSQVRLSGPGRLRTDPDYPAAQLANLVFGGYFSSRLMANIREDKGYTYGASSSLEFWPGRAAVTIAFDTATGSTVPALLETRYELGRLALLPPTAGEVEAARNYALGTLATSLSTQAGYASMLSSLAGQGLGIEWLREHPGRLAKATVDQVAALAAELFAPSAMTGVVVGDLAQVSSGLAALGGVELP